MSYLDTLKLNNSTFQIPDIDSIGERFRELYGSPLVASTVASMINTEKVYVYTGSETGYTSGHWYYWNGSAWTDGGVYNSSAINTDSTLSIAGMAADAKATGDEISDLKSDLGDLSELETEDKTSIVNALNEARGSSGSGLTADVKQALLDCFENVAWTTADGQDYYDALEDALYPPADLVSISAVYTQSGTVYNTDTLDSLKTDLVVTALHDDSTIETVTTYTLSGTLAVGTSTITVTYGGKTTTFNVVVSEDANPLATMTYEVGGLSDGNNNVGLVDMSTRARMETVLPCSSGVRFNAMDGYQIVVYMFSSELDYHTSNIGAITYQYGRLNSSPAWSDTFTVSNDNCKYVLIAFKKTDGSDFTEEDVASGLYGVAYSAVTYERPEPTSLLYYTNGQSYNLNVGSAYKGGKVTATNRARINTAAITSGTFDIVDPYTYALCLWELDNNATCLRNTGYVSTATISDNCSYVMLAFKRLDDAAFSNEEFNNLYGTVFTYSEV